MNLWKLRKAKKSEISIGNWSTGKMPRTAFPMSGSRTRAYRLGKAWNWSIITFNSADSQYRILVAFRTDKEQFQAKLAVNDAGDMKLVARLEYHPTHDGWHVHYANQPMDKVPSGIVCGPWVKRKECLKHQDFGFLENQAKSRAVTIVLNVFGLRYSGPDEFKL